MRKINKIVVHCADTPASMDIGVDEIRNWHVNENGWSDIGYHEVIRRDGVTEMGRPYEQAGAHIRGENSDSIGICLVGGKPNANFTLKQYEALKTRIQFHLTQYHLTLDDVHMHYEYDPGKQCPMFDVRELLK